MCDYDPPLPVYQDQASSSDEEDISAFVLNPLSATNHQCVEFDQYDTNEPFQASSLNTEKYLHPTIRDPNCDPSWPLAAYWPVYMSNFPLDSLEEGARNEQISTFFASKGLLTRMVYISECLDDYFHYHQKRTMLLDMLVYFTSENDANRAIELCHKTTYYGHRLSVFSGRTPIYFDPTRTVNFRIQHNVSVMYTETFIEQRFGRMGIGADLIDTIAKHSDKEVLVEFGGNESLNKAISHERVWMSFRLKEPIKKQRYLEQDCILDLLRKFQEQPSFKGMVPPQKLLHELIIGNIPKVETLWEAETDPRPIPERAQRRVKHGKQYFKELKKKGQKVKKSKKKNGKKLSEIIKQTGKEFLGFETEKVTTELWTVFMQRQFEKTQLRMSKRKKFLLDSHQVPGPTRDQYCYDLLTLETQMRGIVEKSNGQLQCPELEKGMLKAFRIADDVESLMERFKPVDGDSSTASTGNDSEASTITVITQNSPVSLRNYQITIQERLQKVYHIWYVQQTELSGDAAHQQCL